MKFSRILHLLNLNVLSLIMTSMEDSRTLKPFLFWASNSKYILPESLKKNLRAWVEIEESI